MLINEIPPNTNITILVHRGLDNLTFETKTVAITDEQELKLFAQLQKNNPANFFTVVETIKEDDKVVGFPVGNIQYVLDCIVDSKPYLFNGIQINAIKLPTGNEYHIIFSDKNMNPYNRRQEFRLWLGIDGIAQLGLNRAAREVVIKDISLNGIGFVTGLDYSCNLGDIAHISFSDKLINRSTREITDLNFSITAQVVHIQELDEKSKHIGCKIVNKSRSSTIDRYIAAKQMERMQRSRAITDEND
jgi:hypothetical protein